MHFSIQLVKKHLKLKVRYLKYLMDSEDAMLSAMGAALKGVVFLNVPEALF